MANKSLNRATRTLQLLTLQHQHKGTLPNAQALATIYLTLVDNSADSSHWRLWQPLALLVLGAEAVGSMVQANIRQRH